MRADKDKLLLVRTIAAWREWLDEHHASEPLVWLVFHKLHTGLATIEDKDALDEALCYGWVDSLVKRLDDQRYARKFTPRKADSRWSAVNRQRYAALQASGRLKPAGLARAPTSRGDAPRPPKLSLPSTLPQYMQEAFRRHPVAFRNFKALPPEERRRYFAWIESAQRDETRARRLAEAIRLLTADKVLGLK